MKQREIKFRGWDEKSKTMLYTTANQTIWAGGLNGTIASDGPTAFIPNEYIMQFTGLLDKNGKEIFEGDILNLNYPLRENNEGEMNYLPIEVVINFQNGCFWFTGEGYTDCNWHFYNASDREIIGNIYQNPDLLK